MKKRISILLLVMTTLIPGTMFAADIIGKYKNQAGTVTIKKAGQEYAVEVSTAADGGRL